MEIMLPNEEITTVEFEYEKLERVRDLSLFRINQRKVLNRMEAERRWAHERRQLGPHPTYSYKRAYRSKGFSQIIDQEP
ncbi:unnamed protein product [Arabis nemorensis]|uniref:Uncharacterized protein n=1 Tax=Arabis nemorensis TaxID=586526 RepID=A0A565BPU7_9BRAS|nr:unnamed protein product [Arabis nemorensis]